MIKQANCTECTLQGKTPVPGFGNRNKPIIAIIGEAPGRNEESQGRPFVGQAGQVLKKVLNNMGVDDSQCYYTNVCLCRPDANRDPTAKEQQSCFPRLKAEIESVDPQMILTVGKTATKAVLGKDKLQQNRGKILESRLNGRKAIPTFHPASCLYPGGDTTLPFISSDVDRAKRYILGETMPFSSSRVEVYTLKSKERVRDVVQEFLAQDQKVLSFDWETEGTDPRTGTGFCLGFCWDKNRGFVVPMSVVRESLYDLHDMFRSATLMAFNAPFDTMWNKAYGLPHDIGHDPMLMHYIIDERPQQRNLENLTMHYCDAPNYESELMQKYNCSKSEMTKVIPADEIYYYCGLDVIWTWRLARVLAHELKDDPKLIYLYKNFMLPAAEAVRDMQEAGLWVDVPMLQERKEEYEKEIENCKEALKQLTGWENFNPNSHQQVQKFVWDRLGLTEPNFYGRKNRSFDKATREVVKETLDPDNVEAHRFIDAFDNYKEVHTIWSRYLRDLPKYVDDDNRIRCQYHLDRTETGRLSTTNPAIHQIPRDARVRSVFSAPPGKVLIQADYEQIEIRMAAHVAQDEKLTQLLIQLEEEGTDFHTKMASEAYKIPLEEVTKELRQAAKEVSFGLLYLMSDKKLAIRTGLSDKEAVEFVKNYKSMMPGVWEWVDDIRRQIKERGFVESAFGRRRRFALLTNDNIDNLHREAVNMPIQSSSSDLTLAKLIELNKVFKEQYPEAKCVLNVHDSLGIECPEVLVREVAVIVKERMEVPPFETRVPFPAEVNIGKRWGEKEEAV